MLSSSRAQDAPAAKGAGSAGARPRESGGEGYAQADHRGRRHAKLRRRAGALSAPSHAAASLHHTTHAPELAPRMRRRRRCWRSSRTTSCSAGRAMRRATASGSSSGAPSAVCSVAAAAACSSSSGLQRRRGLRSRRPRTRERESRGPAAPPTAACQRVQTADAASGTPRHPSAPLGTPSTSGTPRAPES